MYHYNFNMTNQQWTDLRELSARTELGVTEHMRRAVDAYLAAHGLGCWFVSGNVAAFLQPVLSGR